MDFLIDIKEAVPRMPEMIFAAPVNWTLRRGEHWAVVGPNGAGKTIFSDIVTEKIPLKEGVIASCDGFKISEQVASIAFRDIYNVADYTNMYYQQRWNSSESDEAPLAGSLLGEREQSEKTLSLLRFFDAEELPSKPIILLSSGELRKFLIIRSLLSNPSVLILDNPYIGLDAASREHLDNLFVRMTQTEGLQIILILSDPGDIPDFITHVQPIRDKKLYPSRSRADFQKDGNVIEQLFPAEEVENISFPSLRDQEPNYKNAVEMKNITIRYGGRTILKDLDWVVGKGDKWSLSGPNGSGKSTLLSLVCGDNPQAYANDISLFDRKRGSGESIWDIKKRIGYISPEVHLYYLRNVSCLQIAGSGFFDSIGLYRECSIEQLRVAERWMEIFGVGHLKNRSFMKISYGEQRLTLMARTFVKDPELIVLDEPLHGLDLSNKRKASEIIEQFCGQKEKTLIYVTHYPHELPPCVDKRLVLEKRI